MSKRIVIALGGNALGNCPSEQKELVKVPAKKIANLIQMGNDIIIGHGNGPQVGMIFNSFKDAKINNPKTADVMLAESGAMSQGYIGIHLLNAIKNELIKINTKKDVVYFLTQTIVDKNCPSFKNPTKPIGPFYTSKQEAEISNPGSIIIEDSGRGYRKVVASPEPLDFLGIETFKKNINEKAIVILGGGGGIPTIFDNNEYKTVDAVIDKDFALSKIAEKVDADTLLILTSVDYIYINFNKPNQKKLEVVSVKELEKYIDENQFSKGSMLPKVQAAIKFVKSKPGCEAIIADLLKVELAIGGKSGTRIVA
ncbi:MAG: carbamate kinase [Mycoplasmoidaceae bacterium]